MQSNPKHAKGTLEKKEKKRLCLSALIREKPEENEIHWDSM